MLRRASGRLLAQLEGSSSGVISSSTCALPQQLQQRAGFAKKGDGVDGRLQKVMKMLEPDEDVDLVEVSEEDYAEGMRRAKEFSKLKMREHREWQADLTTKLKLKQAALAALPPHLRAAAELPDNEPFPLNRQMWTDSPPIEGFGQATAATQQAGAKKLGTKHR